MFCIAAINVISEWVVTKSSNKTVKQSPTECYPRDKLTDFTVGTWDQSTIEYDQERKTFWN